MATSLASCGGGRSRSSPMLRCEARRTTPAGVHLPADSPMSEVVPPIRTLRWTGSAIVRGHCRPRGILAVDFDVWSGCCLRSGPAGHGSQIPQGETS